ncbi:hypothetical protein E5082_08715 [Streptomyces griseoluteus]|uniref:Uncharacterized protein n=1 Tax=Streptomyces griseoluteus TaxID=29306 RepID=A0A4Z1DSH5_STRGP|nr:hypothetical protein [Streptomyces griseoluteus]TGN86151.1 hypothetical protein E5082_08715 [Streptomyces griseoluteus]GHE88310.1 hypothetical protein GCM10017776_00150 [Streptomyces griseoluteus]
MPVPAHPRPHPAGARLPWWALALPVLAFVALLLLLMNPSDAQAASGDPALAHILERARQLAEH